MALHTGLQHVARYDWTKYMLLAAGNGMKRHANNLSVRHCCKQDMCQHAELADYGLSRHPVCVNATSCCLGLSKNRILANLGQYACRKHAWSSISCEDVASEQAGNCADRHFLFVNARSLCLLKLQNTKGLM